MSNARLKSISETNGAPINTKGVKKHEIETVRKNHSKVQGSGPLDQLRAKKARNSKNGVKNTGDCKDQKTKKKRPHKYTRANTNNKDPVQGNADGTAEAKQISYELEGQILTQPRQQYFDPSEPDKFNSGS